MPTQEDINAANVELQIANDNYAQLADRYNKYQKLFQEYAKASPEIQERAKEAMGYALEDFYQTQEKMYAAEDRINVAQNALNNYNSIIASQPVQQVTTSQPTTRRRTINLQQPIITQNPNTSRDQYNRGQNQQLDNAIYKFNQLGNNGVYDNLNNYNSQVKINPAIINNNSGMGVAKLTSAPSIPYEIQNVQNARGNDYLRGMKDLENKYGYRVFNQKAYDDYGNVYSLK